MWLLSKYVKENTDIKILMSGEGQMNCFVVIFISIMHLVQMN